MQEEMLSDKRNKSMFFPIAVCESILAILLIFSILISKYFFKKPYKQIKQWYAENIMVDTDIEELIKEAKNEI